MLYRLAALCGEWNVECEGGLIDQIPPEQMDAWAEFYRLEPWGCFADDMRIGMLGQLTAVAGLSGEHKITHETFHVGKWPKPIEAEEPE